MLSLVFSQPPKDSSPGELAAGLRACAEPGEPPGERRTAPHPQSLWFTHSQPGSQNRIVRVARDSALSVQPTPEFTSNVKGTNSTPTGPLLRSCSQPACTLYSASCTTDGDTSRYFYSLTTPTLPGWRWESWAFAESAVTPGEREPAPGPQAECSISEPGFSLLLKTPHV